jgi:hypothetical protein
MAASLHSLSVSKQIFMTMLYIIIIITQHKTVECFRLTMACSAIYFLDMKGKVLMNRNYRGDIENNVIDKFIGWFSWC